MVVGSRRHVSRPLRGGRREDERLMAHVTLSLRNGVRCGVWEGSGGRRRVSLACRAVRVVVCCIFFGARRRQG